jgi:hypothetical protein
MSFFDRIVCYLLSLSLALPAAPMLLLRQRDRKTPPRAGGPRSREQRLPGRSI